MLYNECLFKHCRFNEGNGANLPPHGTLRTRLGRAVRNLRIAAGYSQEGFADKVGVHRTFMGSVERGEVNISLDNIERIAKSLELTAGELLLEAETYQE